MVSFFQELAEYNINTFLIKNKTCTQIFFYQFLMYETWILSVIYIYIYT